MEAASGSRPRLSFLTSAYRTEAYLRGTITSVLRQTDPHWELVVVDNGMSDAIAAIVREFADDPRVHLLRQENRGYAGGVMAAAAVARGDYYSVLDSDDEVVPEFVATVLEFLDGHPSVDGVGCDAHMVLDGDDRPSLRSYLQSIGSRPPPSGTPLTVEEALGGRVPYYTGAVRAESWRAVGGYQPGVESDVLMWLRLADRFSVWLLPDKLGRYRVRGESESRHPDRVEDFERSFIHTLESYAAESGLPGHRAIVQSPVRRLRYHQALRRARWAFVDGDVAAARRHARDAREQRATLRSAGIVLLLHLWPRLLIRMHPLKQRLASGVHRARQRILGWGAPPWPPVRARSGSDGAGSRGVPRAGGRRGVRP
ncbi:glycosyltransferase family 2 protein [Trujillonella endophytica]|uniref:Glycosyl transferase family 2 n=1 Tax=Trujillonella endophytica TaxID=673521 RepID=A0A1H8W107_9ACTN|nr:glycosyltransferase family A protein [Trujillella endophytica]SEP21197.1 Glycosyl transferase family 2 [Trujillella endophytica]